MFKRQTSYMKGHAVFKHAFNPFAQIGVMLAITLTVLIGFAVRNAFAMPMATITCDSIWSNAIRMDISTASGWGGLDARFVISPARLDHPTDYPPNYTITEAYANGTGMITQVGLERNTTYTINLELSDSTIIDTVTCTTTGTHHSVSAVATLYSIDGVVVNNNNNNFSNATVVEPGSDLVYRYAVTNDGPVDLDVHTNFGLVAGPGGPDSYSLGLFFSPFGYFDNLVSGDVDSDWVIDQGETWLYDVEFANVTDADETTAGTIEFGPLFSYWDTNNDQIIKKLSYEMVRVEDAPTGSLTCDAETETTIDVGYTATNPGAHYAMRIARTAPGSAGVGTVFTNTGGSRTDVGLSSGTTYTYELQYHAGGQWQTITGSDITCDTDVNYSPALALKKYVTVNSGTDALTSYPGVQRDAQTAPGPIVPLGSNPEYVITVENTGDTAIFIGGEANNHATFEVTDDTCDTAVAYQQGDTTDNNRLDTDETWIYTCTINNITAQTTNTAGVIGNPVDGAGADIAGESNLTDNDPANVTPSSPDLALIKTTTATTVSQGQDVTFTIAVHNQGNATARNIEIADYIPAGMTLSVNGNSDWTADATGTMATTTIAGPLVAGDDTSIDIVLRVNNPWVSNDTTIVNYAEIKAAENNSGGVLGDIDSTPDMTQANDCGGVVNAASDDQLDGDAVAGDDCDEDDHDPAGVTLVFNPSIDIEKVVGYPDQGDQFDADTEADRVAVATGADATITIYVTNNGDTALTLPDNQPAVDEVCTGLTIFDQGDSDPNDILSVGEVWTYTCLIEDVFDPGTCEVSVVANPVFPDGTDITSLQDVTDEDPIFLDIGGSLFGLTVENGTGGLEETGTTTNATMFIVFGTVLLGGATFTAQLGTNKRFATTTSGTQQTARSGAQAMTVETTTTSTETRGQQNRSHKGDKPTGRDGVLFKV